MRGGRGRFGVSPHLACSKAARPWAAAMKNTGPDRPRLQRRRSRARPGAAAAADRDAQDLRSSRIARTLS